jgi:putative oxidoreductase
MKSRRQPVMPNPACSHFSTCIWGKTKLRLPRGGFVIPDSSFRFVFPAGAAQAARMKIVASIVRILLGLTFVVFGFNGFFHFIPMGAPPVPESPAGQFFAAVSTTGYMNVIFLCQIIGGLLVLLNLLPVLGLAILCPIVFNIVLFHATMAPSGLPLAIGVTVLTLILIWFYWDHYRHLLRQPNK